MEDFILDEILEQVIRLATILGKAGEQSGEIESQSAVIPIHHHFPIGDLHPNRPRKFPRDLRRFGKGLSVQAHQLSYGA